MRKNLPARAALVIAGLALFAALGGSAWAESLINGAQIKNRSITSRKIGRRQVKNINLAPGAVRSPDLGAGAVTSAGLASGAVTSSSLADQSVTSSKLADGAVTTSQLGDNAVTGAKVAPGSLTASDVAPNTFLAANGTAANSDQLGGTPASGFVQGTGFMLRNWAQIPVGTSDQFLVDVGLGEIDGSCLAGDKPQVSFTAEAQPLNLIEWGTTFPSTQDINTANGLLIGSTFPEQNTSGVPQAIQFQVAQTNATPARVATVWTTDQAIGGTSCIFTAQAITTGV